MSEIVVYTAVTGTYDTILPAFAGWREESAFTAFTDQPEAPVGWTKRDLPDSNPDPCRRAKVMKILPHLYFPDAGYSVWLDGSIEIISRMRLSELVESSLRTADLAVFRHRRRRCIYDEADACIEKQKDSAAIIRAQMSKYRGLGYPENNGLAECTVLIRRHTERLRRLNECWYAEIEAHSRRDQLSFNFACHLTGVSYSELPGLISENPHFRRRRHTGNPRSISAEAGVPVAHVASS